MSDVRMDPLRDSVQSLPGVGPRRTELLGRLGIRTVGDLLAHRPRRYEDRRISGSLEGLTAGEAVAVRGRIAGVKRLQRRRGSGGSLELVLDGGGARLLCRFFNAKAIPPGMEEEAECLVYGTVLDGDPPRMDQPEWEPIRQSGCIGLHVGRIVPVYAAVEGLSQRWLRTAVRTALDSAGASLCDTAPAVPGTDPMPRRQAVERLHFPESMDEVEPARRRLALDEFIRLQTRLNRRRERLMARAPRRIVPSDHTRVRPFLRRLGFDLTRGQQQVLREIRVDLESGRPMRRLLQGDVGSGKTVVSACAILMVLEGGWRSVLMAPTEALVEQHIDTFGRWFKPLGIDVNRVTGRGGTEAKRGIGLDVGTHALLGDRYTPDELGLVVIDEQHRFGVRQRERLVRKGRFPHLLAMSATPIPRTLGLTVHGDLDQSMLRERPAGRGIVRTRIRDPEALPAVWSWVRTELESGRRGYIVAPRVDVADDASTATVVREAEALSERLAPHPVGLLHGRLSGEDRSEVLTAFRRGSVQALVATSLIEVGLDVPEASFMVILDAHRFGVAQLHQMRGRVGRGSARGTCVLVVGNGGIEARGRLEVLERESDGFAIAEADLRDRGPGDFLGAAQWGIPPLRFGDLVCDGDLVQAARRWVRGTDT